MITRTRSDPALIRRYAAGDESAFDALYERYRQPVLAVCIGVLGTAHDAEDAVQETFASLAVVLRASPPRELRPWLTRVARNAAIDVVRRRRRRALTLDGEVPDVAAHPAAAGADELAVVIDEIRELPHGQRTALLMRELGGHSYAEIATLLETDQEAVRGLIARARTRLRGYRDARAPRAVVPVPAGGVAGGGVFAGALAAAKGVLVGAGVMQATACAASICAVGGFVLLTPPAQPPPGPPPRAHATRPPPAGGPAGRYAGVRASAQPLTAPPSRSSVSSRWTTPPADRRASQPRPVSGRPVADRTVPGRSATTWTTRSPPPATPSPGGIPPS